MKKLKNYFVMALVAISFTFASCSDAWENSADVNSLNDYGLKWDAITQKIIDEYGILRDYVVVFVEGDELGYRVSNDTMYVTYPNPGTHVDTIYITETEYIVDTVVITKDHGYIIVVDYGTDNTYFVKPGDPNDSIFITFRQEPSVIEDEYSLDVNPTYDNAKFTSLDVTSYVYDDEVDLRGVNNRRGEVSSDVDTLWITSAGSSVGSATRKYASRKQAAGVRDGLDVAKDSCAYVFNYEGADYEMNIAAESLKGTSNADGTTKELLYLAPQTATVEINNIVDNNDTIHHDGKVCYKVRQIVTGTFTSTRMPEQGSTVYYNDVVVADNKDNVEMPVVYLIGDDIPVTQDTVPVVPQDTTVTPDPGFIFPDGERADSAQISVVLDRSGRGILVEGILIHTASDIYMVVDGVYVGSVACTNHSLYNSLFMINGQWTPAYMKSESTGVTWYNKKGGSSYGGLTKDQIDYMMANGRARITTNYASQFVREMVMVNVGETTTFTIDGNGKFTASSSTVK